MAPFAFSDVAGAVPARMATMDGAGWTRSASEFAARGATLVALWGADRRDLGDGLVVYAAYGAREGLSALRLHPFLKLARPGLR